MRAVYSQEGWEATSVLLGSASMSLIDPGSKERACHGDGGGGGGGCSDGQNPLAGHRSVDSESVGLTGRRALGWEHSPTPDKPFMDRPDAAEVEPTVGGSVSPNTDIVAFPRLGAKKKRKVGVLTGGARKGAAAAKGGGGGGGGRGGRGGGTNASGAAATVCSSEGTPARDSSSEVETGRKDKQVDDLPIKGGTRRKNPRRGRQQPLPTQQLSNELNQSKPDGKKTNSVKSEQNQARREETGRGGGSGDRIRRETPSERDISKSARPDGPRGGSRGVIEGGGEGGSEGGRRGRGGEIGGGGQGGLTEEEVRRPDEEGRRRSKGMEFPTQTEALPDWVDTIKASSFR